MNGERPGPGPAAFGPHWELLEGLEQLMLEAFISIPVMAELRGKSLALAQDHIHERSKPKTHNRSDHARGHSSPCPTHHRASAQGR